MLKAPDYDSAARPPRAIEELVDLASHPHVLVALIERNVKVRYKRSVLGFAWTMAQPATLLVVLTLVFSEAFERAAPLYPAYLGPGLVLWYFFSQSTSIVVAEVAAGVDLWRRVRMPKTALAVATVCTGLLNLALATVPLVAILAAVGVELGAPLLTLPVVAVLAGMFTLGLALVVSAAAIYFPDIGDLYAMILVPWMFVTPIIYPRSMLTPGVDRLVALNPMAVFVEAFRSPMYANSAAPLSSFATMAAVASITLAAGWYIFTRCASDSATRG